MSKAAKDFESREKGPILDLSALRLLIIGGEANRTASLDEADKLGRQYSAREYFIKAAYGLLETCSTCFYNMQSSSYDLERQNLFPTVGEYSSPRLELRVVDKHLNPVSRGQRGAIRLCGDMVFSGYYDNQIAATDCTTEDS